MSRGIQEMEPGDFVKVVPGRYEEIASVSPGVGPGRQFPKHFHVITKEGRTVDMFQTLSYRKKNEPRP